MWRVNGEGLVFLVPSGCCLQSTDVGAMAKLGLSIAADDFVFVGLCEPLFLLLRCGLALECNLGALTCRWRNCRTEVTLNMVS